MKGKKAIFMLIIGAFFAFLLFILASGILSKNSTFKEANPLVSRLFQEGEHFLGNPDAPVKIVEYGEVECPYCKKLHPIMEKIAAEYEGKTVWVFRHFPLARHPKSAVEALALECVAEAGGENAFWKYLSILFQVTPSNNNIDVAILPQLAARVGVSTEEFNTCMESGKYEEYIQRNRDSGILWGVVKVPHIIIIAPNGKEYPISGARSYDFMKKIIDIALTQK